MNRPSQPTNGGPAWLAILGVAVVYGVAAKVSFFFTIEPGNISPIFPAAGVALAAVMLLGRNALAGVWLGSFLANTASFADGSVGSGRPGLPDLLVGSAIGLGAMSGAGAGAFLVRRFCAGEHPLHSGRNVLMLIAVGAFGCGMISPTFGVLSLSLAGMIPWERFGYSWVTWWVGDAAGALVAAPLLLTWHQPHPFRENARRKLEAAALGAATFLVCFFVFFRNKPFEYGLLPLVLWGAFRFGVRGASTTTAAVALFAMIGTSRGTSPFAGGSVNESLLLLNSFFGVTITCALFMAGVMNEQRRAKEHLAKSERKYRELVELANSIILRWDSEGRITFLNDFGQRFFGYPSAEILGRHVLGTIVPGTESTGRDLQRLMERICANPQAFEQNVNENVRRNGDRVWIAWTNRIVRDGQGQVVEILSVGTDVTERKRAQEALRRSEEQFRLIMENLADLVAVLDLDGCRLYNSPSYAAILGDPVRLQGSSSFEQVHPDDQAMVRRAFQETVRTGVGCRLEYRLVDRSARSRHIESQGSVIRDAQGQVAQVIVVSRDITERRQAEEQVRVLHEELKRYAEQLEQRVAERTAELAVAKDRAEAADRLKSTFLATMSHELRTPLNSIIGFTGILLQGLAGPLNPEQAKQLDMVRSSARHLLALINDVLDISKIEAGQLQVIRASFDVRASILKVVELVRPLAEKKRLALRVDLPVELGQVVSDPRRVEQILLNLLNNAIKFTDRGKVTLTAQRVPFPLGHSPSALSTPHSALRGSQSAIRIPHSAIRNPQSELRLAVADTGIGIQPEDLATLFQPFRQIDTGLTRNQDGTGLGLAICRRLAHLLGGEIRVESVWQQGSTFSFILPVVE